MSTMKWTFKGIKPAFNTNADEITVSEYEFYTDSRGGGSSTTTQYYEGEVLQDKSGMAMYSPPKGKKIELGKDFTFESPKTFAFGDPLKNKKWLVYGLIAVAGYFAYKKFNK